MRWHLGPFGEKNAVKKQRDFFRQLALEKEASHLYFIDCDTIPPLDAIPRLLAHNKDVVGGVYVSRHDQSRYYKGKEVPLAWRDTPEPYSYTEEPGLVKVDGMGAGSVLISRRALGDISYDYADNQDDWPVYRQLASKGYDIWLDPTIKCKHYKTEDNYI